MLVPIGAWCRTAFQVKQYEESRGNESKSYPFDWTITPFFSLRHTLASSFSPQQILKFSEIGISYCGSIVDKSSSIIFHHDLNPKITKQSTNFDGSLNFDRLNPYLIKTQQRFEHTFNHFLELKNSCQALGFVRWQRQGHPDHNLPNAFSGETFESLFHILSDFLSHRNFFILQIQTKLDNNFSFQDIIESLTVDNYGMRAVIKERRGYNGDLSTNFRGDSRSWGYILDHFCSTFRV